MKLTGKHILGAELKASGRTTFRPVNPETGEEIEPAVFEGTDADVEQATDLAAGAEGPYSETAFEHRALFLEHIADEILRLGDVLIQRARSETGLPEARLTGERGRTVFQLRFFAEVVREGSWVDARIDTPLPDRKPVPRPDVRSMLKAIGPVVVFGASNFPLAFSVAGGDTASALAAGCPVIVKGHPAHPGTSELVGRAIQEAVRNSDMPEGTFSLVQGQGHHVGAALVGDPTVKAVGFTGSFRGGKALYDVATHRPEPIPVFAETGSTNPIFILPEALSERGEAIAEGLADSVTLGVGQFCTNPGLVFGIAGEAFDRFADAAASAIRSRPAATMLTRGIQTAYEAGIRERVSEETRLVAEAAGELSAARCEGVPRLLRTTGSAFSATSRLEEEVFGPSSVLVACNSADELRRIAGSLHGHLTATIHATEAELERFRDLVTTLERKAGRIIFNGFPTGVEVCHAMVHGGPFPATTDSRWTSVGSTAMRRFLRPTCYQDFPESVLPEPLRDRNSLGLWRTINGALSKTDVPR